MRSQFCREHCLASPQISVIIPTFNSSRTLETCFTSIRNQTCKNIEAIVVDAYSTDDTCKVAQRYGARLLRLAAERSPARNLGAKEASGHFVFFIDSDMELTPNVIQEALKACMQQGADAVIVPEESVGEGFLAKCKKLEKKMRWQEAHGEAPRFFKKSVFEFLGGYDERLVIGEDFELAQRVSSVRFKVGRIKSTIRHHEGHLSLRKLTAKLYYYGKTLPTYAREKPSLSLKTSSPVRFLKNLSLLKQQPACYAGLCSLKLVEYLAYLSGALASLLSSE